MNTVRSTLTHSDSRGIHSKMKHIGILGSGAREIAIAKNLYNSKLFERITLIGRTENIAPKLFEWNIEFIPITQTMACTADWCQFLLNISIDVIIVGSENDLATGITDACAHEDIICIGPTRDLAQLETSKGFCRQLIEEAELSQYNPQWCYWTPMTNVTLEFSDKPVVVKCDGPCGGKGVFLNRDNMPIHEFVNKSVAEIRRMNPDSPIILEERLMGVEFGLFSLTDGRNFLHMPPVFDFKTRSKDGPNTGGMASIMFANSGVYGNIRPGLALEAERVNEQVIRALQTKCDDVYRGFVYGSFIVLPTGELKVIEYNARLGDPEAILLMHSMSNFGQIIDAYIDTLSDAKLVINGWSKIPIQLDIPANASCLMTKYLVPPKYGLDQTNDNGNAIWFHPVTKLEDIANYIYPAAMSAISSLNGTNMIMYKLGTSRTLAVVQTGTDAVHAEKLCDEFIDENILGDYYYRNGIFADFHEHSPTTFQQMIHASMQAIPCPLLGKGDCSDPCKGRPSGVDGGGCHRAIKTPALVTENTIENASVNVDLDAANRFVDLLKGLGACDGGYAGECHISAESTEDIILTATCDGVGTKVLLARTPDEYAGLGADIFNHCCNDLMIQGGTPYAFLDYLGCHTLEPEKHIHIVRGMTEQARRLDVRMMGGETAEMGDIYRPGVVDIVGIMIGINQDEKMFRFEKNDIRDGTIIFALPSSGLHTNGYTMARHVLESSGKLEEWRSQLLATHTNYYERFRDLPLNIRDKILGLCHITGGGLLDNPVRILPKGSRCVFDTAVILEKMPEIFRVIQAMGNIDNRTMFHTFNCGLGMLVFVSPRHQSVVQQAFPDAYIVGRVVYDAPVIDFGNEVTKHGMLGDNME